MAMQFLLTLYNNGLASPAFCKYLFMLKTIIICYCAKFCLQCFDAVEEHLARKNVE